MVCRCLNGLSSDDLGRRDPAERLSSSLSVPWARFRVPGLENELWGHASSYALFSNVGIIIGESVSAHLPSGYRNTFKFRTLTFIGCLWCFLCPVLASRWTHC